MVRTGLLGAFLRPCQAGGFWIEVRTNRVETAKQTKTSLWLIYISRNNQCITWFTWLVIDFMSWYLTIQNLKTTTYIYNIYNINTYKHCIYITELWFYFLVDICWHPSWLTESESSIKPPHLYGIVRITTCRWGDVVNHMGCYLVGGFNHLEKY